MTGLHREGDSMTARRAGTTLALLTGAALLVAACAGAAATNAPTNAAGTQAPPSQPSASGAAPSEGLPGFSFVLPSFTSDAELAALFPTELGGEPMTAFTMTGADFMSMGAGSKDIETALQQLGKTPADLSVGSGGTSKITIFAFQIKGVPADQFLGKYLSSTAVGSTVTDAAFGGKSVKKVVTGGQVSAYLYLSGDILWTVDGNAPTDALLTEAFSKLP
jgi:hypothetical protein